MAVRLLHPFTGEIVELPSLATLMPQLKALFNPFDIAQIKEKGFLCYLRKVCAAVSYSPDGVVTAMLAFNDMLPRVAFATSEDRQWTLKLGSPTTENGDLGIERQAILPHNPITVFCGRSAPTCGEEVLSSFIVLSAATKDDRCLPTGQNQSPFVSGRV